MIPRELAEKASAMARKFPVVSITGPRQSGKSTLVKALFADYSYTSLEDEGMRKARGRKPKLFFWRDSAGREIDILVEHGIELAWAIEAKSSSTYSPRFFKNLDTEAEALGIPRERRVVVYAGNESYQTSHGLLCAFKDLSSLDLLRKR